MIVIVKNSQRLEVLAVIASVFRIYEYSINSNTCIVK